MIFRRSKVHLTHWASEITNKCEQQNLSDNMFEKIAQKNGNRSP